MDCRIKKARGRSNAYEVTLRGITRGGVLSLKNALEKHVACGSAVAGDVLAFLVGAVEASGDSELVRAVLTAPELDARSAGACPTVQGTSSTR